MDDDVEYAGLALLLLLGGCGEPAPQDKLGSLFTRRPMVWP
ncbi:hypothetical protein Y017_08985 [Alcanivorax sp. 97CO-5]|nr:hypothetical protein Y017_08985 [Alcanivorax sp. 97CO-5]